MTDRHKIDLNRPVIREEDEIIQDAEKVRSGEDAEAEDRARDIADGVDFAVAPDDVETRSSEETSESTTEIDFDDGETENEDHGRGLV